MTKKEKLIQQAVDNGAEVIEHRFQSERIKGLYCDGTIATSDRLKTSAEQTSILAEELGHHMTAYGNILDQDDVMNRKQELRGRIWAYNRLIGLEGIVNAYKAGCRNRYEMAAYLDVTEELLIDALEYYREKYGQYARYKQYAIRLDPLMVIRWV